MSRRDAAEKLEGLLGVVDVLLDGDRAGRGVPLDGRRRRVRRRIEDGLHRVLDVEPDVVGQLLDHRPLARERTAVGESDLADHLTVEGPALARAGDERRLPVGVEARLPAGRHSELDLTADLVSRVARELVLRPLHVHHRSHLVVDESTPDAVLDGPGRQDWVRDDVLRADVVLSHLFASSLPT